MFHYKIKKHLKNENNNYKDMDDVVIHIFYDPISGPWLAKINGVYQNLLINNTKTCITQKTK